MRAGFTSRCAVGGAGSEPQAPCTFGLSRISLALGIIPDLEFDSSKKKDGQVGCQEQRRHPRRREHSGRNSRCRVDQQLARELAVADQDADVINSDPGDQVGFVRRRNFVDLGQHRGRNQFQPAKSTKRSASTSVSKKTCKQTS